MVIKKYQKYDETSYTLGATISIELLKTHPECVRRVLVHSKLHSPEIIQTLKHLCNAHNIEIDYNDKAFRILSQKENCFVIALFNKYEMALSNQNRHIVLVEPSNSGNLGTIMRSMLGFEVCDLVIIKPGADCFDPKAIRASMGAVFHLNIKYFDSFEDYRGAYPIRPLFPFMLDANAQTLKHTVFPSDSTLVFGNEARGLPEYFSKIGTPVKIMHGHSIDSLNLPIALSIALYECTDY